MERGPFLTAAAGGGAAPRCRVPGSVSSRRRAVPGLRAAAWPQAWSKASWSSSCWATGPIPARLRLPGIDLDRFF